MFLNIHLGSIDQMGMCKMPENALFCVAFLVNCQCCMQCLKSYFLEKYTQQFGMAKPICFVCVL